MCRSPEPLQELIGRDPWWREEEDEEEGWDGGWEQGWDGAAAAGGDAMGQPALPFPCLTELRCGGICLTLDGLDWLAKGRPALTRVTGLRIKLDALEGHPSHPSHPGRPVPTRGAAAAGGCDVEAQRVGVLLMEGLWCG